MTLAKSAKIAKEDKEINMDRIMDENEIGTIVVDTAIEVHQELGPGLLESVYEVVLAQALRGRGLHARRQMPISIRYRNLTFDEGFRADIVVEHKLILELKCVDRLNNAHRKQVLTYLRLTEMRLGYLLNFSAALMKDGVVRIVNGLERGMSDATFRTKTSEE